MAGVGPVPKENARRRNDVDLSHLDPEGEVPEKLKKLRDRANKNADTQLWWDTWVHSPQAEKFQATDWLCLQRVAVMVNKFYDPKSKSYGSHYVAAEIRQNETLLGATIADRMRLRMKAKDDKADTPDDLPEDVADFVKFRKQA
jgi:hypothetical protein